MWKQDKRTTTGLFGGLLSLILFIVSCFSIGNQAPLVNIFFLCLTAFFLGYLFKGIRLGIILFAGIVAVLLIAFLLGDFGNYLVENGYVSDSSRKLFASLFLPVVLLLTLFIWKTRTKKSNAADYSQGQMDAENEAQELSLGGAFIILIKPNAFKVDMVYKVFIKDGGLFFCRVGGQFYEINELVFDWTPDKEEAQLLSEKDNFKIPLKDINGITVRKKKSMWTGAIPNNGVAEFALGGKKEKYILHPVTEYGCLVDYFRNTGIPVNEKE